MHCKTIASSKTSVRNNYKASILRHTFWSIFGKIERTWSYSLLSQVSINLASGIHLLPYTTNTFDIALGEIGNSWRLNQPKFYFYKTFVVSADCHMCREMVLWSKSFSLYLIFLHSIKNSSGVNWITHTVLFKKSMKFLYFLLFFWNSLRISSMPSPKTWRAI